MENKFYGIPDKFNMSGDTKLYQKNIEEIEISGYTIFHDIFSEDKVDYASKILDEIYLDQVASFGIENLKKINEQNLVRSPLLYDRIFLDMIIQSPIKEIVSCFLGNYYIINQQNGIINTPNEEHHQSAWHRDLPYQDYVISKPIAIAALICLDDFTRERGSTFVLPFSHKLPALPSIEYLETQKFSINAKRGSVIIFNAMLYHKAGYNSSTHIRRGLNTLFTIPLISQQINISKQLKGKYSEDLFLRKILGYDAQIPDNVNEYRRTRLLRIS